MAKKTGIEKREEAARLLAEGWSTDDVGRRIGVRGSTVRSWRRNDTEFQRLLQQYLDAAYGRGLLLAAQRGVSVTVKGNAGATAAEEFRGALVDMARKDSRRADGGHFNNNQENS